MREVWWIYPWYHENTLLSSWVGKSSPPSSPIPLPHFAIPLLSNTLDIEVSILVSAGGTSRTRASILCIAHYGYYHHHLWMSCQRTLLYSLALHRDWGSAVMNGGCRPMTAWCFHSKPLHPDLCVCEATVSALWTPIEVADIFCIVIHNKRLYREWPLWSSQCPLQPETRTVI